MLEEEKAAECLAQLSMMRQARRKGFCDPRKPVLLLAVIYRVETGWMTDGRVVPDKALKETFANYWRLLVDCGHTEAMKVGQGLMLASERVYPYKCSMAEPFLDMADEPFWTLVESDRWEERAVYSLRTVRRCYRYAELSPALFEAMGDEVCRARMRALLEQKILGGGE